MNDIPTRLAEHLPVLTEVIERAPQPHAQRKEPALADGFPKIELDFSEAVVVDDPAPNTAVAAAATFAPETSPEIAQPMAAAQAPSPTNTVDASYLAQRVRSNVQLQLEHMLEARLREAVLPMLTQQTDLLVQRLRTDLMLWLDDMVEKAVAQEIARRND